MQCASTPTMPPQEPLQRPMPDATISMAKTGAQMPMSIRPIARDRMEIRIHLHIQ
jgi:hypothetical protein